MEEKTVTENIRDYVTNANEYMKLSMCMTKEERDEAFKKLLEEKDKIQEMISEIDKTINKL